MPDKNIVIDESGNPNESMASISRGKKVLFFPTDSDHTVTVRFTNDLPPFVPFSDWTRRTKTGKKGQPLSGKVRGDFIGFPTFLYTAKSSPGIKGVLVAQPQLIVDGGGVAPKKRRAKKAARKK